MNRPVHLLVLGALAVFFAGCAPRQAPMYYFGKSELALYASKRLPTEENRQKLRESLEDVVQQSQKDGMRVPPGVFAHLGYLKLLENNTAEATLFFAREKQLYPEATVFMDRMINKIETTTLDAEGGENDA